ncbi:hypothetical protein FJ365_02165 [Candidatus Dependentiae bacterium]|nr:hypothetical protein [Candidatus Dependentiae bacterium]
MDQANITTIDQRMIRARILPFLDLTSKAALTSTNKSFKLFIGKEIKQVANKIVFPPCDATNPSPLSNESTKELILGLAPKKILQKKYPVNDQNKYIVSISMLKNLLFDSVEEEEADRIEEIIAKEIKFYNEFYKKALENATSAQAACADIGAAKAQFDETKDEITRMGLRFAWFHRTAGDLDENVPLSSIIHDEIDDTEAWNPATNTFYLETNTTLNFEPINRLSNHEEISSLIINFATSRRLEHKGYRLTLANCNLPFSYSQKYPVIIQNYTQLCLEGALCSKSLENIFAPKLTELVLSGHFPELTSTGEPFTPRLQIFSIYQGTANPTAPILPNFEKLILNAPLLNFIEIGIQTDDDSLHTNMPKLTSTNINEGKMTFIRHSISGMLDYGFETILTTINHNKAHQAPAATLLMADHNPIAPQPEGIDAAEEALPQIAANMPEGSN